MQDQDLRVRYYACESLYNVVKVSRGAILPHFSAIFNALSKIATDPEQNVKNASELLDRLLKVSYVTENMHLFKCWSLGIKKFVTHFYCCNCSKIQSQTILWQLPF